MEESGDSPSTRVRQLLDALRLSTERAVGREPTGTLLFSGGLDSGLLAHLLPSGPRVQLLTVGLPDSPDLVFAESVVEQFASPWRGVRLGADDLRRRWQSAPEEVRGLREPSRSVQFALDVALGFVDAGPVLLGQGADELFGGYAHFEGLTPQLAEARGQEDLRRLDEEDWPRTVRLAQRRGLELRAPYLDREFRSLVESTRPDLRFGGAGRKPLLRAVARAAGLPVGISERPKKALQYGSGVARELRRWVAAEAAPVARASRGSGSPPLRPGRAPAREGR